MINNPKFWDEYKIVWNASLFNLEKDINKYMEDGWLIFGYVTSANGNGWFIDMVKNNEKAEKA